MHSVLTRDKKIAKTTRSVARKTIPVYGAFERVNVEAN